MNVSDEMRFCTVEVDRGCFFTSYTLTDEDWSSSLSPSLFALSDAKQSMPFMFTPFSAALKEEVANCGAHAKCMDVVRTHQKVVRRTVGGGDNDFLGMTLSSCSLGLQWTLATSDGSPIAVIKFTPRVFIAGPTQFQLILYPTTRIDALDLTHINRYPHEPSSTSTTSSQGPYTLPEPSPSSSKKGIFCTRCSPMDVITDLHSRPPVWNCELQDWQHNMGARVRFPDHVNFLVVRDDCVDESGEWSLRHVDRTIVRHGKTGRGRYVLDFRSPVSSLVALAVMCAVHSPKLLVRT